MPDVNVLIYAHREDDPVHAAYARWLGELVNGSQPFALSVLVAVAFVRIVTNATAFSSPTPLGHALGAIEHLAAQPRCRVLAPGTGHFSRVAQLCRATQATSKLVADAQHAALAMSEGCTWVTRDRDFSRFAPYGLSLQHLELS